MGKNRIALFTVAIVCALIFLKTSVHLRLDPTSESFTNAEMCPACFGNSLCPQFYHGDISLIGISRLAYLRSSKNVYDGKLKRVRVVLKKLAHDSEISDTDAFICKLGNNQKSCIVSEALKNLVGNSVLTLNFNRLIDILIIPDTLTDISQCPTERLFKYMFNKLHNGKDEYYQRGEVLVHKLGEMLYSLLLNPEAILLQAFPQAEGWPFPYYYGACGRVIVQEYVGKTLAYFEDALWKQRIDIAYQLLLIAQTLTENASDFALYMTDVNMDNFAVRSDGTVLLIDVENIVIVDRLKLRKDPKRIEKLHHSKGEFCKDCLNFSFEELCNYDKSDHNYYAICKGLLVPGSYFSPKGLLHSMPKNVKTQTNLSFLIEECANPSKLNRFQVVPKVLQVMKSLL